MHCILLPLINSLTGVLTFLMEATIPAITVFYSKWFAPFSRQGSLQQKLLVTTREIFDNLMVSLSHNNFTSWACCPCSLIEYFVILCLCLLNLILSE